MSDVPAEWFQDPTGRHDHRYWDGTHWTEHVADLGVASVEPYDGPNVPPQITVAPEPTPEPQPTPEPEPEPSPATPIPRAESSSGGGSRRAIVLVALAAVVAIVVVIVLLVTNDNGSDASGSTAGRALSAQLAGRLRSANGFGAKDAECVSDYMVDHLGTTRLKGVDLTGEQVPTALQSDFAKALGDGVVHCKVSGPSLSTSGSTPALPANPQDEATTKQLFVQFYELTLGLTPTQSQCLADQMFSKLNAGKATLGNAASQLPDALKTCKISSDVLDKLSHS